ncbi:MAG: aspartate carbamoyltransferase [Chloroflexi bacterium RBG_16_68_14]|nr:MAG: aspartate carbamoyltransferase [Chloroflexi bacterium RBG_16_68_14]
MDLDDFSAAEIELVLETADAMKEVLAREVPRVPTLRGTTIVTLFYEESTRTRASFELAGKVLGADVINISSSGSSVQKGESLVDTVRTIQAIGADVLVIRHSASGAPYLAAREADFRVVNAGDGWHAHPTQALLDAYTIRSRLGDVRGRKVVIVGDITHSRVARSNLWGLTALGAEVVVCGPPTLLPAGLDGLCARDDAVEGDLPPVRVEHDLDQAIEGADVVMALRLQKERQQAGLLPSLREYSRLYQVNSERLARARPDAFVMHPGPINEGVEISAELAHGARSLIEEQVTNGVAVRMAVLYLLLRGEKPV